MSGLYAMRFVGQTGIGAGAVYVGRGRVVGIDAANGRYHGTYVDQSGRMKGSISLSIPGGGTLVTGQPVSGTSKIDIHLDLPSNFANGQPQQITVAGRPVSVTFEKIGDVP